LAGFSFLLHPLASAASSNTLEQHHQQAQAPQNHACDACLKQRDRLKSADPIRA
jgi:hypothetical protein